MALSRVSMYQSMPDIYVDNTENNPCIYSPNSIYAIFFFQTKDTLFVDTDTFGRFLHNAVQNFRHTRIYTKYKSYLFGLGLTSCQMMGNIDTSMVGDKGIEMHHNGITIFDIALMICHHILCVTGKVSTFDIITELRESHLHNQVPVIMLCKTMHQMVHNNDEFFVPCVMTFGFWTELLEKYRFGITFDIAKKLFYWIKISLEHANNDETLNKELLGLKENIESWCEFNEYRMSNNRYNAVTPGTRFDKLSCMPLVDSK